MGIEVDGYLRPQAYHFYANHPGDTYAGNTRTNGRRIRVPADEVIHLFLPERPGQTRGVTWFASALMRLHMLQGYEEAEVVRARASSALMGFIQSPEGELVGDEIYEGDRVSEFTPGVFKYLAPGESVAPDWIVVAPPTVPVPASVAPEATVMAPVANEESPSIRSVPACTDVAPR